MDNEAVYGVLDLLCCIGLLMGEYLLIFFFILLNAAISLLSHTAGQRISWDHVLNGINKKVDFFKLTAQQQAPPLLFPSLFLQK
jgi:hypothetical protein